MPLYTIRNKSTGEVKEEFLSMSEYDEKLKDPNFERVWDEAPALISGYNMKPAEGFRDILKNIKKTHRGSNINTF